MIPAATGGWGPAPNFTSTVTPRNDIGSLGDAVQAFQAGEIPDDLYPNTCND